MQETDDRRNFSFISLDCTLLLKETFLEAAACTHVQTRYYYGLFTRMTSRCVNKKPHCPFDKNRPGENCHPRTLEFDSMKSKIIAKKSSKRDDCSSFSFQPSKEIYR